MEIQDRTAIVTGAGTGVGRATALKLASGGCAVVVNYRRSQEAAEQVAEEARAQGVDAFAHRCDVTDDADCRELVVAAVDRFGRLDILVNNAGTTHFIPHGDLDKVTPEVWQQIMAVNVAGPFQCTRAAKPAIEKSGGGEVVNVSSVAGLIGSGSSIPYCASKAALNSLTVTLARVCAPSIRVNAVAPGFIDGSWLKQGLGPAFDAIKQAVTSRAALARVCTPDDIADAILSFITGSDLVTGNVLPVEGGMIIGSGV